MVGSRCVELFSPDYQLLTPEIDELDITKAAALGRFLRAERPQQVIHLAGYTDVNKAHEQTGDKNGACYKINVWGTRNLARLCRKFGMYLVHVSTDFVFDGKKQTPYTEQDSPHPIEWYGRTKYWAEQEVKKSGTDSAIIRIAFPFRAHFPKKVDLIRTILMRLEDESLYPMFVDQVITPTYIDDIATAMRTILTKRPTGIFHIVGSSSLSPYSLARKVATSFGFDPGLVKKGSLSEYLKKAQRPYQRNLALSNAKAERELGIRMRTIDEALKDLKSQRQGSDYTSRRQTSGR